MRAILTHLFGPATLALVAFAAAGTTQAHAQSCSGGAALSASEITTLLDGRYACGSSGNQSWNELHSGGVITDFKKGPTDPRDPSTVVGSYQIGGTSPGTVTYTYNGGGGTYQYQIRSAGTPATTTAGFYAFCGQAGAQNFVINVTPSSSCLAP